MSRTLKRPMFRIGGAANDGIISIAQTRKNYENGSDYRKRIEELKPILTEAAGPGPSTYSDLGDLLISGGLNLLSGKGAGKGTLGAIAESYKDPYATFAKARSAEDAFKRQINLAAATQGISSVDAERLARIKTAADLGKDIEMRKKELMQQYALNYTEASRFQNFLNKSKEIEAITGLPVATAPLPLVFSQGKLQLPYIKNYREGIYYDAKNNKYIKIQTGTLVIGDSIQELMKPVEQKQISPPPEYPPIASDSP